MMENLRFAFKRAIRTGKIRENTISLSTHAMKRHVSDHNIPEFDIYSVGDWSRFMKVCTENEWKVFEVKERMFRQAIATKPMHVRRSYHHPHPHEWLALADLLRKIFFRDGTFCSTKLNGVPFSLPFVKYVVRILHHFPVELPELSPEWFENEHDKYLSMIEFCLKYVTDNVCTYFSRLNRPDRDTHRDVPIIQKGELTQLWQESQKTAIDIINNDCRKLTPKGCQIDLTKVHEHFHRRCQPETTSWNEEPIPPPPEWTPPDIVFSVVEVTTVIKTLPARRSPGWDGVTYDYIKHHRHSLAPVITKIMNICAINKRVPQEWKHSIITLVKKKNGDPNKIEDWRPISLLCASYKIFMKLIQKRLIPWIVETGRMSSRQKGSMPRNGLQEHVFTLKTGVSDFLHQSSKLYVMFIDIKDAFGSIDHHLMLRELEQTGYPQQVIDITRDVYTNSTFQVRTAEGLTLPVKRGKGIIQGCPWSVIIFQQGINKWLRSIEEEYDMPHIPNPIQGYVDDVVLVSEKESKIIEAARKTEEFMTFSGMQVKHSKCALLHGQRTGNNWSRNDTTSATTLSIQNATIPKLSKTESYKYLGYDIDISGTSEKTQMAKIIREFEETLQKIDLSPLPVATKLQAINIMAMSRLHFYFPNMTFTEKALSELEDATVCKVRSWLDLNDSSTRKIMFSPRNKGGLGILNPRIMYHAKKLAFFLDMLNNSDEQTRTAARQSLQLHLSKRKCTRENDPNNSNFGGFKTDDNYRLMKNCKVNWRQSQWMHFNELCGRLKLRLQIMQSDKYVLFAEADNNVKVCLADAASVFIFIKTKLINQMVEDWKSKESQGRLARATGINHTLSSSHLTNFHLSDKLTQFVVKARLQLLECNSVLHIYYPAIHPKKCARCDFVSETVSHLLNGCRENKVTSQKRHDRVVEIVHRNVREANQQTEILTDQIVTQYPFTSDRLPFEGVSHTKPDICVVDRENKKCTIIEVSIPFDAFLDECYQTKFDKYMPLCLEIQKVGFDCRIYVLVIGSLGSVHTRFVSGLQRCGVPRHKAKGIARYASVSAMMGSRIAWKQRCSHVLSGRLSD